jgi:hypothetical protein
MSDGDRIVARLFGAMLMIVGVLIVALAGLCSAAFLVTMGMNSGGLFFSNIGVVLLFGGVPIAMGVGLFIGGRALVDGPRRKPPKVDPQTFE